MGDAHRAMFNSAQKAYFALIGLKSAWAIVHGTNLGDSAAQRDLELAMLALDQEIREISEQLGATLWAVRDARELRDDRLYS